MKTLNSPQKIILAVDLKSDFSERIRKTWMVLCSLFGSRDLVIEPVSILDRSDAALGEALENQIGTLSGAAERHLNKQLKGLGLQGLSKATVLFADGSSTQRAVMALTDYAKKTSCDLIAISSHSRRGIKRLLLGSFAETLSLQSPIPLLIINPNQRIVISKLQHILFPTDFSAASRTALETVCHSLDRERAKVILFHQFQSPVQYYAEPLIMVPIPQALIDEEFKKTEKLGQEWCEQVRKLGITCEFLIDRKRPQVSNAILSAARRYKAGMIAMVSRSGKVSSTIFGSVTRQVLRNSPIPVWVMHPVSSGAGKKSQKRRRTTPPRPRVEVTWAARAAQGLPKQ